jgi:hypothetical protein
VRCSLILNSLVNCSEEGFRFIASFVFTNYYNNLKIQSFPRPKYSILHISASLKKHQSNIERKNKIIRWINIQQRTIKVILVNFLIEGLGNAKKINGYLDGGR